MSAIESIRLGLVGSRDPDEIIHDEVSGAKVPYLLRWFVKPKRENEGNVYLHLFLRSDFDRALHDHPFDSTSLILHGQYIEHLEGSFAVVREAGDYITRPAIAAHRIELINNQPCLSLFVTGPKIRDWGFHCASGWTPWQQFVANRC